MKFIRISLFILGTICLSKPAPSCGPFFPNCYLVDSYASLLTLPTLSFEAELERLLSPADLARRRQTAILNEKQMSDLELSEVAEALDLSRVAGGSRQSFLADYIRTKLYPALPEEFNRYAEGAGAWHRDDPDAAVAAWRKLLLLPESERLHRTLWAEYMICRALHQAAPEECRQMAAVVRRDANGPYRDTQQLARAALGWEARSYLLENDIRTALTIYFEQFTAGAPGAKESIQAVLRKIFFGADRLQSTVTPASPDTVFIPPPSSLRDLAADATLRKIVTAWFSSRGGPFTSWGQEEGKHYKEWIGAVHNLASLPAEEADRWAWVAYQNGLFEEAQGFVDRAPPTAPASEWVRAMLALRDGKVAIAADHLAVAAQAFPRDQGFSPLVTLSDDWSMEPGAGTSDLAGLGGVLAMKREKFGDALRLFLTGQHWVDAAYIAERVLTIEELTAIVREYTQQREQALATAEPEENNSPARAPADPTEELRHLLARRLMRANHATAAREYFGPEIQTILDQYIAALKSAYDESKPAEDRARKFWAAAQLARTHGMNLFGTELGPDYAVCYGEYQWPDFATRSSGERYLAQRRHRWGPKGLLAPSDAEWDRLDKITLPTQRYHYRDRAADLAWLAAGLLPNDTDEMANILVTAGHWVAAREPDAADRFYKALVVRCPQTELGRQAKIAHWLPKPPAKDNTTGL